MAGQNRIVVDYGSYEGLVLLGAYENETGKEVEFDILKKFDGFDIAKKYNGISDYSILGGMISDDREGYVIRFKNGFRVKIKGDEYKRLHRILTNISSRDIWEYLKDNKPFNEILEKVPDEFYSWVKFTKAELELQYFVIEREYRLIYESIIKSLNPKDRKSFAEIALKYKYPKLLFLQHDNKDCRKVIWDLIYPNYSKPFKKEI